MKNTLLFLPFPKDDCEVMSGEGRVGLVDVEGSSCLGGCCWETTEGVAIGVHVEPITDTVVERER